MFCKKEKFNVIEQVWMQVSFHGIWILSTIAIAYESICIAAFYVVCFPLIGILYFIMHSWICPRCPHIKEHGSCVQLPSFITKRIIKKGYIDALKKHEIIGFFIVLYGIVAFPLYWILDNPILYIPFGILAIMHYGAYAIWFCKRCLNTACPQNLNKYSTSSSASISEK